VRTHFGWEGVRRHLVHVRDYMYQQAIKLLITQSRNPNLPIEWYDHFPLYNRNCHWRRVWNTYITYYITELHCVHEKTITLDNVRQKCQIWTHPNQIACAWLRIYLRQNCQIS